MAWHAVARPALLLLLYAVTYVDAIVKNLGEFFFRYLPNIGIGHACCHVGYVSLDRCAHV